MDSARTNVANAFVSMLWAITPEKLAAIQGIVQRYELGIKLDEDQIISELAKTQSSDPTLRVSNDEVQPNIGIVPVLDTLMNRASLFDAISGATSYSSIASQVRSFADDEDITHILLDFDTPGGTVDGVEVAAEAIRYAKERKPVIAVVNDMAASAGYWLASQATSIYVTKSSIVGSIGVMYAHVDTTEAERQLGIKTTVLHSGEDKAIGHPSVPLSEDHQKKIQGRLDTTHQHFISSVASGRGMSEDEVKPLATGFVFNGREAVQNGLADGYGTIHSVIQSILTSETMSKEKEQPQGNSSSQETPQAEAPKAQTQEGKENGQITLEGLASTVNQLASVVGTLAERQREQAEQASKERAQALINPLVQSGAVTPAKGQELIRQATENYDLVANLVESLRPNMAVPYEGVVEPGSGRQAARSIVGGEQRQVFQQLGLLDANGKINLRSVTLPLDANGQITHRRDEVRYDVDRVAPEVQQVMGQFGQWQA